jgi:hypothetical protein
MIANRCTRCKGIGWREAAERRMPLQSWTKSAINVAKEVILPEPTARETPSSYVPSVEAGRDRTGLMRRQPSTLRRRPAVTRCFMRPGHNHVACPPPVTGKTCGCCRRGLELFHPIPGGVSARTDAPWAHFFGGGNPCA